MMREQNRYLDVPQHAGVIAVDRRGAGPDRLGAALGEAIAERGSGFDERLARLARAHVRFALEHPALFAWMFEAKNRPDAPRALLEAGDRVFAHASAVFRDGQAWGSVIAGDPEHLGLVGFAAMQGLITISTQGKFMGAPLDTVVSDVIQSIILGLRPLDKETKRGRASSTG